MHDTHKYSSRIINRTILSEIHHVPLIRRGCIAARIAAKRAGDKNGLEGKLLQACGHETVASLAGDHELLPTGSHLEHAGSMADEKVKVIHIKKPSPEATILRPPTVSPVDLPRRCSSPSMRLWNIFPIAMTIPYCRFSAPAISVLARS